MCVYVPGSGGAVVGHALTDTQVISSILLIVQEPSVDNYSENNRSMINTQTQKSNN